MKLPVLIKSNEENYKVDLFLVKNYDLPFSTVLEKHILPMKSEFLNIEKINPYYYYKKDKFVPCYKFRIRQNKKPVEGLIVYKSYEDLADFIVKYYIPTGFYLIDNILKQAQKLSKYKIKQILIDTFIRWKQEILSSSHSTLKENIQKSLFPAVSFDHIAKCENVIVLNFYKTQIMTNFGQRIEKMFFPIVIKETKEISGKTIPVFNKFLLSIVEGYVYYNGNQYFFKKTQDINTLISFLGEKTYDEFDKKGEIISTETETEIMVPFEFKVQFLLKVPTKNQLKKMLKKDVDYYKIPQWFDTAYFVYDARYIPHLLNEKIKIVDKPEEIIPILSRTEKYTAIPNTTPAESVLFSFCEAEEYYLAYGYY